MSKTIELMEQLLIAEKMKQVADAIKQFRLYCEENDIEERKYDRIVRLHKDMTQEKVFVYKYEDACSVIKAVNKIMNKEA